MNMDERKQRLLKAYYEGFDSLFELAEKMLVSKDCYMEGYEEGYEHGLYKGMARREAFSQEEEPEKNM